MTWRAVSVRPQAEEDVPRLQDVAAAAAAAAVDAAAALRQTQLLLERQKAERVAAEATAVLSCKVGTHG